LVDESGAASGGDDAVFECGAGEDRDGDGLRRLECRGWSNPGGGSAEEDCVGWQIGGEFGCGWLIGEDECIVGWESALLQLSEAMMNESEDFGCGKCFPAGGVYEGLGGGEESAEGDVWEPLDGLGEGVAVGAGADANELSAGFNGGEDGDISAGLSCGEREEFGVVEVVQCDGEPRDNSGQFSDD
jgi:hypothetical protein